MRVPHRGDYSGVPHQLLNRRQWHATHREMRRECVPESMPTDLSKARFPAEPPHCSAESIAGKRPTVDCEEHVSGVSLSLIQHCVEIDVERYVPRSVALWRD